jgi:hypothetical protein
VENSVQQVQQAAERLVGPPPPATEDEVTKTLERYTAAVPSSAYLAVAIGAMGASFLFQVAGRGKWGNFVAQWVPTWLIIGLYNKLVKLEGHDRADRDTQSNPPARRSRRAAGISNRAVEEEQREQSELPRRGKAAGR